MSNTIPPPRNPTVQQLHEAARRKRKPLVDLAATERQQAIASRDATIDNLQRQLRQHQEANTAKEAYIQELEGKLKKALEKNKEPVASPITEPDETSQGRRARRPRVEPEQDNAPEEPKAPEEQPKNPAEQQAE